jgi:O-antigen ligase
LVLDATFHIKDLILGLLGRDATLTDRTALWEVVRSQEANPIIGVGFMSFWTGERMRAIWDTVGEGINQAHNGYLEQYVNLGYVGVTFIGVIMLSALLKVRRGLDIDAPAAVLRLCLLVAAALYNYTEASFYGINNMWLLLLVASIDIAGLSRIDRTRQSTKLESSTRSLKGRRWQHGHSTVPSGRRRPQRHRVGISTTQTFRTD